MTGLGIRSSWVALWYKKLNMSQICSSVVPFPSNGVTVHPVAQSNSFVTMHYSQPLSTIRHSWLWSSWNILLSYFLDSPLSRISTFLLVWPRLYPSCSSLYWYSSDQQRNPLRLGSGPLLSPHPSSSFSPLTVSVPCVFTTPWSVCLGQNSPPCSILNQLPAWRL